MTMTRKMGARKLVDKRFPKTTNTMMDEGRNCDTKYIDDVTHREFTCQKGRKIKA